MPVARCAFLGSRCNAHRKDAAITDLISRKPHSPAADPLAKSDKQRHLDG
jgi:hypothetical protein